MKLVRVLNDKNEWILASPDALDNYYIGSQIGKGEYGTIHRGYDKLSLSEVAIKKIFIKDDEKLDESQHEIIVLKHLTDRLIEHPNLLAFKAAFLQETNGIQTLYIITEFLPGITLYGIYNTVSHRISSQGAWSMIKQLVNAVNVLHTNKVMHRDLKLENIMYSSSRFTLIDFGASRLEGSRCKSIVGSPLYLPPEWYRNNLDCTEHDHYKYDIWAMGVVIYEVIYKQSHIDEHINNLQEVAKVYEGMFQCGTKKIPLKTNDLLTTDIRWVLNSCLTLDCVNRPSISDIHTYVESVGG